jgi:hypothetical protein
MGNPHTQIHSFAHEKFENRHFTICSNQIENGEKKEEKKETLLFRFKD